ncbi:MAG: DNA mismatch repair protein MutS [Candidatus Cloacimonadaceae bacterium]|jgi:DNA mismatch repair protein MutS|nr:DNA mismatch repair protein MutS [Candidatus Cloacimonadota bacterium]MDY0380609.1 DNA mismatch repair protein MutS [Candidatus Cloacimonadaceae bacterium]MCB5263373.1 DNA mismatch repair protein MutS [Candidatus Cloacimonadota bacterium]MCB5276601.1 DNA mismatch repair protein MutS [Candidatus Cloacimonadota bacterium]MCK9434119.1 DNA mismatch repair protein MutS [Candidatus Cloacimonadota bacterium]
MENTKLTPMLRQYFEVKQAHPDKLVLFRMGDFYETFFEDAVTASRILNITLTTRNKNDDKPIPLAGFPYHALENYLDKLIKSGLKVAICEQTEDPKKAVGLVKREVTEIITPGAVLDQNLLEGTANVFLSTMYRSDRQKLCGLAHLDLSTGEFFFTELAEEELANELQRLRPAEILVDSSVNEAYVKELKLEHNPTISIFDNWQFQPAEAKALLLKHFGVSSLEPFGAHNRPYGATAAGATLAYVMSLYKVPLTHITALRFYSLSQYMQLDEISRRNLELTRSIRYGNRHGSLLSVIDQSQTPMGSRLLQQWLLHPLIELDQILARQAIVSAFMKQSAYLKDIRVSLKEIGDISRIVSRLGSLRINPRELLALQSYLISAKELKHKLEIFSEDLFADWISMLDTFEDIDAMIDKAIAENPPNTITEGGIFKQGYQNDLDELMELVHDGKSWIARLEDDEKRKTGIPSLKVGYNRVFGYYIEVTTTHKSKVPDYYIPKQTLVNSERYISPRLKEFEAKVLSSEEKIKNLEYELYKELRTELATHLPRLQRLSDIIGEIDVYSSMAYLAWQNHYCCPVFSENRNLHIEAGRHPVIEKLMGEAEFIPNDTQLDYPETCIALITGPNMAGKSTYLRQVGLLVILAQIGSYVPANAMQMPIFDRVFTRVGASDNLAQGQSTFLVEMIETANILNSATPQSLILLDEIGRGTSTFDGLSLAWAIIEQIQKQIKALTLFATHYHELTELENIYPDIKNYNVAVKLYDEQMIFIRKIERGGADQSYGIQVARLAGIPNRVIRRAQEILKNLEEHEISPQGLSKSLRKKLASSTPQLEIFEVMIDKANEHEAIINQIRELEPEELSPIAAWQLLSELQKQILGES